jgi:hypothetical protein
MLSPGGIGELAASGLIEEVAAPNVWKDSFEGESYYVLTEKGRNTARIFALPASSGHRIETAATPG